MITPSQLPSSTTIAQGKGSAPYAGPERRVADRRRSSDASARTGGYHELGPYLPERIRAKQRTPGTPVSVFAASAGAESPVSDAVSFEVLDEEFIMAEAILAEAAPQEAPTHEAPQHEAPQHEALHDDDDSSHIAASEANPADEQRAIAPPRAGIELPWITAFLDDVPEAVQLGESHAASELPRADAGTSDVAGALADTASTSELPVAAAVTASQSVAEPVADQAAIEAELWPLDDAGSRMRELATELQSHTAPDAPSAEQSAIDQHNARVSGETPVTALAAWSDDDFVDVMPVHVTSLPPHSATPDAPTVRAVPSPESGVAQETAALALEALARRVRRGEVDVPAFNTELGDAAALAMALAVLLGPHS